MRTNPITQMKQAKASKTSTPTATALHIEQVANGTITATFVAELQVGHQNEV